MALSKIGQILAVLLLVIVGGLPTVNATADDVYTFVVKKQEEKAKTRWSIQEWLDTRDRMRLMDLWLAIHSPSPYEFFFGGSYCIGSLTAGSGFGGLNFTAAGYATLFGLEVERESGPDTRYDATFHFRFFGYHYQATHMRIELGVRTENNGVGASFQNPLAGVGFAVYLARKFGIDGRWRHAFSSTPNATGLTFGGDQFRGGAFLDFSFVRIYGDYLYETLNFEATNLVPNAVRSGPELGLKLFF
ncbi:hypothetical protein WDW37_09120 [Bdellovibrionota bacterium FG-1]